MPRLKAFDLRLFFVAQIDQRQQIIDHAGAGVRRNVVTGGEEVEIFPHFHVVVDAEEVGHVADGAAHGARVVGDRMPGDPCFAAGGLEQGGQNAHGGGFARPVGPNEAKHVAFLDGEVEVVNGR